MRKRIMRLDSGDWKKRPESKNVNAVIVPIAADGLLVGRGKSGGNIVRLVFPPFAGFLKHWKMERGIEGGDAVAFYMPSSEDCSPPPGSGRSYMPGEYLLGPGALVIGVAVRSSHLSRIMEPWVTRGLDKALEVIDSHNIDHVTLTDLGLTRAVGERKGWSCVLEWLRKLSETAPEAPLGFGPQVWRICEP